MLSKIYPVTCNTAHVGPGSTFVAIKGFKQDGAQYISQAIKLGAKKIVQEGDEKNFTKNDIEYVFVQDARIALSELCEQALDMPAKKLKIIGVTGTAGKTTTTFITHHILKNAGHKVALLGTIKNIIEDEEEESRLTTLEADTLQMFLKKCVEKNVEYVVMEVSSHALELKRTHGIEFEVVAFTNLSPEHLDFHNTMQNYFESKIKIFSQMRNNGSVVVNVDDEWGKKILENKKFCEEKKVYTITKNNFFLENKNLVGEFNSYNIAMAAAICEAIGIDGTKIKEGITSFKGVPGRMQLHKLKNGALAFVDYAHKPGAMECVLKTLRLMTNNLIVIFGCGGERDKTKRPVMGALAAKYGDKVIITDDNPRNEDGDIIVNEILSGILSCQRNKIIVQRDRRGAIAHAVAIAGPGNVIALLGKGHENYYIVGGEKRYFDDFEEIGIY